MIISFPSTNSLIDTHHSPFISSLPPSLLPSLPSTSLSIHQAASFTHHLLSFQPCLQCMEIASPAMLEGKDGPGEGRRLWAPGALRCRVLGAQLGAAELKVGASCPSGRVRS